MEKLEKEKILNKFEDMLKASWTYDRMTEKEKKTFLELLEHPRITETIKGTAKQRWEILDSIYWAYLQGIGYDGCTWRETEKQPF